MVDLRKPLPPLGGGLGAWHKRFVSLFDPLPTGRSGVTPDQNISSFVPLASSTEQFGEIPDTKQKPGTFPNNSISSSEGMEISFTSLAVPGSFEATEEESFGDFDHPLPPNSTYDFPHYFSCGSPVDVRPHQNVPPAYNRLFPSSPMPVVAHGFEFGYDYIKIPTGCFILDSAKNPTCIWFCSEGTKYTGACSFQIRFMVIPQSKNPVIAPYSDKFIRIVDNQVIFLSSPLVFPVLMPAILPS